jgi:quinol monooxygenase YgiN
MHILVVTVHVKQEAVEAFKTAIRDNAQASILEPGVVRFDVLQQADDPTSFILYEVYHSASDHLKHRESAHYLRWKDAVVEMMAEPRQGIRYINLVPGDENFTSPK